MDDRNRQPPEAARHTRAVSRGASLGLFLFGAFVVVAGLIWVLGQAAGLATAPAFFLAACGAPLLVGGLVLVWFFSLPLARRQAMFGVPPHDSEDAAPDEDSPA
jgi:hypothetical protein